jgi:hypothetical protein
MVITVQAYHLPLREQVDLVIYESLPDEGIVIYGSMAVHNPRFIFSQQYRKLRIEGYRGADEFQIDPSLYQMIRGRKIVSFTVEPQ